MTISNCPFCKETAQLHETMNVKTLYRFDCNICGNYFISELVLEKIKDHHLDSKILNCISENIKSNTPAGKFPIVTSWHSRNETELPSLALDVTVKRYEDYSEIPIIHADKEDELLKLIAQKVSLMEPFAKLNLIQKDLYKLKIRDIREAIIWLKELESKNLIKLLAGLINKRLEASHVLPVQITPLGWNYVFQKQKQINSKSVFIAMQFDWGEELKSLQSQFVEEIKQGCRDCGYDAELVSDQEHIEQITDRIISKIKSARFVIADFTFNNRGAYYEAGLTRGLGIPVIHTVMSGHTKHNTDKEKMLHFDIQQINYLEWNSTSDLRQRIRDKIKATIEK